METKICSTCKQKKDINEFFKWRTQCKNCQAELRAQHYAANKEKIAEQKAQYYIVNKEKIVEREKKYRAANKKKIAERKARYRAVHREKNLLEHAKHRAQKKGLDFNITEEDILIPERCPILGYKLKQNKGKVGKSSPTLDRIDNSKGYIKGNIRVISHRANAAKGDYSLKELKAIVKDLERQQNER